MNKDFETAGEDIAASFAALRRDMAKMVEAMSTLVQHQTQAAGVQFSDTVNDATDKLSNTAADAQKRFRAVGGEVEACVERNPFTAALVAFGIGVSLGMLSRSRC